MAFSAREYPWGAVTGYVCGALRGRCFHVAGFHSTPCGTFTLKEGECMGACGDSPVMLVNDKRMCSFMSKEKIDALLSELRAEGKAA